MEDARLVRQTRGPSEADWNSIRPVFTNLYLDQNLQLNEVRQRLLADFGFKTTPKICKTHIRRWGIDKKNKERDMRAVVRLAMKRKAVGKDSTFTVRNRPFDLDCALEYFRRRGTDIQEMLSQDMGDEECSEDVRCSTPKPALVTSLTVPPAVSDPWELKCLETALFNGSILIQGCSTSLELRKITGIITQDLWLLPSSKSLIIIDYACEAAYYMLRENKTDFILRVVTLIVFGQHWLQLPTWWLYLSHVQRISTVVLGSNHPFVQYLFAISYLGQNFFRPIGRQSGDRNYWFFYPHGYLEPIIKDHIQPKESVKAGLWTRKLGRAKVGSLIPFGIMAVNLKIPGISKGTRTRKLEQLSGSKPY